MYLQHFGLTRRPFAIVPNPDFLYRSRRHEKALTHLEYGLSEANGFVLLTGDVGTGKTTLIRHVLRRIDADIATAVLFNTNLAGGELIRMVLQEFEVPATGEKTTDLDALNNFLIEQYREDKRALLIIDEGQNLSFEALEEVRMLSNLHTDEQHLLQIVLVGQPELRFRLQQPNLSQLAQRISVSYHLGPLSREDVGAYVEHRLRAAGHPDALQEGGLFDKASMDAVFEATGGIPRAINILCDAALLYAYADEDDRVTAETVRMVVADRTEEGVFNMGGGEQIRKPGAEQGGQIMELLGARLDALETARLDQGERISRLESLLAERDRSAAEREQQLQDERARTVNRLEHELQTERRKNEKLMQQCTLMQKKLRERDITPMESAASGDGHHPSEPSAERPATLEPLPEPDDHRHSGLWNWLMRA
jgi:putative secretion ATPase (PEP-CTERM system associated)